MGMYPTFKVLVSRAGWISETCFPKAHAQTCKNQYQDKDIPLVERRELTHNHLNRHCFRDSLQSISRTIASRKRTNRLKKQRKKTNTSTQNNPIIPPDLPGTPSTQKPPQHHQWSDDGEDERGMRQLRGAVGDISVVAEEGHINYFGLVQPGFVGCGLR